MNTVTEDVEKNSSEQKSQPLTISQSICDTLKPYLPSSRHEPQRDDIEQEQTEDAPLASDTSVSNEDCDKTDMSAESDKDKKSIDNTPASIPSSSSSSSSKFKPYVTLTYASSLDSTIAAAPNTRTVLSGTQSKALTHYLRSQHDAILIGVGTAIADDPGLNCRLISTCVESRDEMNYTINEDSASPSRQLYHPRPVIIDPSARYHLTRDSKVYKLAKEGLGKGPWIFCGKGPVTKEMMDILAECGGEYVFHALDDVAVQDVENQKKRTSWEKIIWKLGEKGIRSVMVEGGGRVINELLEAEMTKLLDEGRSGDGSGNENRKKPFVDALVVTIAPLYLGFGGVVICPQRLVIPTYTSMELRDRNDDKNDEKLQENEDRKHQQQQQSSLPWQGLRLKQVRWIPMDEDAVMCGLLNSTAT